MWNTCRNTSHMYGSWWKILYSTSFCIGCERANLVFEQICSHCRWITHETWRHMSEKYFSRCRKYGTKEFIKKSKYWWGKAQNSGSDSFAVCYNFSYHDLSHICVSLSQYLEFLGKLFCSILCTYAEVFFTHVPQSFMCNPSATGANLFKHQIGSFTANTEGCAVKYFPPASIHMGLWDTTSTTIFIGVNICYGWINIW